MLLLLLFRSVSACKSEAGWRSGAWSGIVGWGPVGPPLLWSRYHSAVRTARAS